MGEVALSIASFNSIERIKLTVFFCLDVQNRERALEKKVQFKPEFQSSMHIRIIYSSNTPSMTRQTGNVSITVARMWRAVTMWPFQSIKMATTIALNPY